MEPKAFAQYSGARIWTVQVACSAEQGMYVPEKLWLVLLSYGPINGVSRFTCS